MSYLENLTVPLETHESKLPLPILARIKHLL